VSACARIPAFARALRRHLSPRARSTRWAKKNGELEKIIVKTVAGFLNDDGGTLLIGVDDGATVIGLEHDYQTVHKKRRDGYELFPHDLLLHHVGKDLTPQLGITFHALDGKDFCRVAIQPSPPPVFIKEGVDEHLYIRSGNSTRRLTGKETVD
jgi:predicted HTH transcriptional regulator